MHFQPGPPLTSAQSRKTRLPDQETEWAGNRPSGSLPSYSNVSQQHSAHKELTDIKKSINDIYSLIKNQQESIQTMLQLFNTVLVAIIPALTRKEDVHKILHVQEVAEGIQKQNHNGQSR